MFLFSYAFIYFLALLLGFCERSQQKLPQSDSPQVRQVLLTSVMGWAWPEQKKGEPFSSPAGYFMQ